MNSKNLSRIVSELRKKLEEDYYHFTKEHKEQLQEDNFSIDSGYDYANDILNDLIIEIGIDGYELY